MTVLFHDRVQESSTSTGTGDIALGGISQPGLATFSSAFSDGALVSYVVTNQAVNTEFERGIGTFHSGPDSISRTYVLAGTAYPSPTNFSAGTKNVVNPAPANTAGNAYASSYVYVPGDTAVLSGTTWYSLNVNSNSAPSTGNPNWVSLGGGGGGGAVSSVFGRTNAVVASAGDYSSYYGQLATVNTWTQTNTFTGTVQLTGSYIREYYGASGNYSTVGTTAWGGPIWGIDTGFTGGVGAANWSPTGVYGIAWQRSGSSNANANIGEGLYVYQNGTLLGGIGTSGIYANGSGHFNGTISASNFSGSSSGTNTGDQNLAPYALLSGATFTGLVTNTGSYIREYYGASGNYSTVGTSAWGGPIWGVDTSQTGGVGAANWSPSGVYGIAWQRATSTNANANIGEGLYVYQNGVLEGGIGTSGIYSAHTIIAGGAISGSNLSGTNTGDQNLAPYALLSGATFTGTIFAPTFQISSSVVLKQDITPLEDTSILDKMNFYSYRLKANPDKLHFGLIAEELAEISSDLVGYDKDGKPFSINMLELIPLLAKRIETLTKEVAVLRAAK